MNEEVYQGLNSDDREFLETVMAEAADDITESLFQGEEEDLEAAKEEGTTIVGDEDIDREAFVEAGRPFLEQLAEEDWAVGFEEIQAL